jgi:hypothetical protein
VTPIRERALEFSFEQPWAVAVKWDETSAYRERIGRDIQGTDAVDIVAVANSRLLFVEIKDYRWPTATPNLFGRDLIAKVAEKVRDTIAGVCGAARTAGDGTVSSADWERIAGAVANPKMSLFVVLWLEPGSYWPSPSARKTALSTLNQHLKTSLRWLTNRVFVYELSSGQAISGLQVRSLPKPVN